MAPDFLQTGVKTIQFAQYYRKSFKADLLLLFMNYYYHFIAVFHLLIESAVFYRPNWMYSDHSRVAFLTSHVNLSKLARSALDTLLKQPFSNYAQAMVTVTSLRSLTLTACLSNIVFGWNKILSSGVKEGFKYEEFSAGRCWFAKSSSAIKLNVLLNPSLNTFPSSGSSERRKNKLTTVKSPMVYEDLSVLGMSPSLLLNHYSVSQVTLSDWCIFFTPITTPVNTGLETVDFWTNATKQWWTNLFELSEEFCAFYSRQG